MIVVADANALIGLARGEVFGLLEGLFGEVRIPPGVWQEVVVDGAGRAGARETSEARDAGWLRVSPVPPSREPLLATVPDPVDREVLTLAHESSADLLISDDRRVRSVAGLLGLALFSVVDVVVLGKRSGRVPSCREILDRMMANGYHLRDDDYQDGLRRAGEA